MFGKNPIRDNETGQDGQTLAVQEIFYTIQGEGPHAGRPCPFIRLAGCNLACTFCDTEFESGINRRLGLEEIVGTVCAMPIHDLVVLTGGEPMRQNIVPLVEALFNDGVKLIQIETAGTLWVPGLEQFMVYDDDVSPQRPRVELVVSPKTPGLNRMVVSYARHYKYIVQAGRTSLADGLPVYGTQTGSINDMIAIFRPWGDRVVAHFLALDLPPPTIWVSPCDEHESERFELIPGEPTTLNVQEAVRVAMKHGYRLSLQTHKILGLP